MQLRRAAFRWSWRLLWPTARVYRATLAHRTRVVAVTGSYGKTTATRAVRVALGGDPNPIGRNFQSFVAMSLLRIRPWAGHAVVEVGVHRPMARFARLTRPQVVVVTSIGGEHGSVLGGLAEIRHEKAEMVRTLAPSDVAVLNGDDENVIWMATQTAATVRTFGLSEHNDVRATGVEMDWPHGTRFTVRVGDREQAMRTRLLGGPSVLALLAAVTVALAEGRGLRETLSALEGLAPTPGRLQPVALPGGAYVIRDDYKSPIETVDAALDVLADVPAERRVVVLGDVEEPMEDASILYGRVGKRVSEVADRAIYMHHYGHGPRYTTTTSLPAEMVVDAKTGLREALEAVRADLRPGDVVLVKGGHEQRLDRVALALAGRDVRCEVRVCGARATRCETCPMLERGWGNARVVI
jgi:UDP-N-acetylmuramyl pentapeptide synthase